MTITVINFFFLLWIATQSQSGEIASNIPEENFPAGHLSLYHLPCEIIVEIGKYLPDKDLINFLLVTHKFHDLREQIIFEAIKQKSADPEFAQLYKPSIEEEFGTFTNVLQYLPLNFMNTYFINMAQTWENIMPKGFAKYPDKEVEECENQIYIACNYIRFCSYNKDPTNPMIFTLPFHRPAYQVYNQSHILGRMFFNISRLNTIDGPPAKVYLPKIFNKFEKIEHIFISLNSSSSQMPPLKHLPFLKNITIFLNDKDLEISSPKISQALKDLKSVELLNITLNSSIYEGEVPKLSDFMPYLHKIADGSIIDLLEFNISRKETSPDIRKFVESVARHPTLGCLHYKDKQTHTKEKNHKFKS